MRLLRSTTPPATSNRIAMKKGRAPILACGLFLCLPALASCGSGGTAPTPEQNQQLANTDELLNSAPDSLSNIDDNALGAPSNDSSAEVSNRG
jgi:hypothetical protein